jgi:hypothetical protein
MKIETNNHLDRFIQWCAWTNEKWTDDEQDDLDRLIITLFIEINFEWTNPECGEEYIDQFNFRDYDDDTIMVVDNYYLNK